MAQSVKPLFQAIKKKKSIDPDQLEIGDMEESRKPKDERDPLDYDPTPPSATYAFLGAERERMREVGNTVWEPAVGGGHIARVLEANHFDVIGSDVIDRGWPGTIDCSFYRWKARPASIIVTNPPYNEINARDGAGRWLKHILELDVPYVAMLLNWDWAAARINGMDALHEVYPISRAYLCCWKIDFRGGGSPPQRNGWLVWDKQWKGETVMRRLFMEQGNFDQGSLF